MPDSIENVLIKLLPRYTIQKFQPRLSANKQFKLNTYLGVST